MKIGIRELKSRLSEVIERAAAGERIVITDRGRPKAVLSSAIEGDNVALGVSEGWITAGALEGATPPVPHVTIRMQGGLSTEQVLAEDRGA